jgi:hypothetical protein
MNTKLNTGLLFLLLVGLAFNFYRDYQRDEKIKSQQDVSVTAVTHEASPFYTAPKDPVYEAEKPPVGPVTTISFDRTEHDFGKIQESSIYKTVFKFTNTGKEDLLISDAVGSCGCTVPSWSKESIAPGKSGEISVAFDTHGRMGENLKTVTVTSNTNLSKTVLNIHSMVIPISK